MFNPTLIHEYLSQSAEKFSDKEALIFGDERWTYKTLNQYSEHLANILLELGIKRQDRIIIFLDNCPETIISIYGILKAGSIFVVLNGAIKSQKLNYILQDSGATCLITHTNKSKVVKSTLKDLKNPPKIVWIGEPKDIPERLSGSSFLWDDIFNNLLTINANMRNGRKIRIIDYDLAALIYTSGSTGEPKGVMESHFNMNSAARSIIQYLENKTEDIILNVLPLSFDYGLYQVIMAFMFGGTVVLEPYFMFPQKFLQLIEKEQVTGFPIVPTIVTLLLTTKNLSKFNFDSLRYITNTGAALSVEHIYQLKNIFPKARIFSMFGLTECKRVSYLHPDELEKRPTSVGKAMPNCEVYVVNEEGREVASGEIGELVVRGSNVMRGYWNDLQLTKKYFKNDRVSGERLLYSGDLFRKDQDGFLYFIGRKDDMIKTKGERVSPKEIENILYQISGVLENAVIGIPDEILGKAIKAFIVPKPHVQLTEQDVLKYCSKNLELFAIPKYIEFVKKLPKTPNGKIDKKKISSNELKLNYYS